MIIMALKKKKTLFQYYRDIINHRVMTFQTKIIFYGDSISTHKITSKIEGIFYINLRKSNLAE